MNRTSRARSVLRLRRTRSIGVGRLGWIAVVISAVLLSLPSARATAAGLITGRQIKDGSVTGRDVRDASLAPREFGRLRVGPQGPQGPPGLSGDRGPQGAAGSSGWVMIRGDGVVIGASGQATVECPAGLVAVGGGAEAAPALRSEVTESAPEDLSGTGWVVSVRNSVPALPITIFAWVSCVAP